MTLGDLNFNEVWVFFRYRSFPVTLNVLLLFSWVYLLIVYLTNQRKQGYLYLMLGTLVLFSKEVVLFFTVRHVVFGQDLAQIDIYLRDWTVLESVTTFLFAIALSLAYVKTPLQYKFDYPPPQIFKNFYLFVGINSIVLAIWIALIYLSDDRQSMRFSFLLPMFAIGNLGYLAWASRRIRLNYTAFGGGWLNRYVHMVLLGFILIMTVTYVLFSIVGGIFAFTTLSGDFSNTLQEMPETVFHALKTVAYIVYVSFIFLLLTKDYQLANAQEKMQYYISNHSKSIGASMRRQMLRYEAPEGIVQYLLKEVVAYTQAQFAFFCYYNSKDKSLYYFDYTSEVSSNKDVLSQVDITPFLETIIKRNKPILIDELEELSSDLRKHFLYLAPASGGEGHDEESIEYKFFPLPVESMIAVPIKEQGSLLYAIILINKLDDYYEEWKEEKAYSFLEAVAEDVRFLKDYMLDHQGFIKKRNAEFDLRMGMEQSRVLSQANTLLKQDLAKNAISDFSFSVSVAYEHLPLRTVTAVRSFRKKMPLVFFADINGDTASRAYLGGMLHAAFENASNTEKSTATLMRHLNNVLSLSEQKNFISGNIYFYDRDRRKLFFSNAAHGPILIFHVASNELIAYDIDNPPLCIGKDMPYREANTDINEGDIVITCSDELFNLKNERGALVFDPFRINGIIKKLDEKNPENIAKQLAYECHQMELSVTSQIVFLAARVGDA